MNCPYCGSSKNEVFNSRSTRGGTQVWRRRRCLGCHRNLTTYERLDLSYLRVDSSTASRSIPYSRARLMLSVASCFSADKRGISETIDNVVDTIESKLIQQHNEQIASAAMGDIILQTLKPISTTAFMKYLADHSNLQSSTELKKILKQY